MMKWLLAQAALIWAATASALPPSHVFETRTTRDSTWKAYSVGDPGSVGACGFLIHKSAFGIALSVEEFEPRLCGRIISLKHEGKQAFSQVLDSCSSCRRGDFNITERLFKYFSDDTSVPLVGEWEFGG